MALDVRRPSNKGGDAVSLPIQLSILPPISADESATAFALTEDRRVLDTADDRPNAASLPSLVDPASDHADACVADRRDDVDEKHKRVIDFLEATGYDAVILGRSDSIAWFTSGADLGRTLGGDSASAWLYVNRNCRAVVADNVQSARIFEEEVAGLGFQLKERPWHEEPERVLKELAHGKRVAIDDVRIGEGEPAADALRALRLRLTKLDRRHFRELGRTLTLAIEATARNFQPGETEADLAGHLAHRLLREGVVPVDLRVAGDDRLDRYRRPLFKSAEIHRRAVIAATGRRHGLCASATRIVSFGPVESAFRQAHALASMIDATYIFFSRPGEPISEIYRRAKRIYEKYQAPHEWMLDYQGFFTGYSACELALRPDDSARKIEPDTAIRWSPSVGPTRSEDTIVVDSRGYEVVTEAQRWPKVEVVVKGFTIPRPGILER